MSTFYRYFQENMSALGLTAPDSLFGTQQTALGTITTLLTYIDKFGTRVTVGEMIAAGTKLETLATVGAYQVAYYAGAAIGSLAVATGRTLSGGTSLGDVLYEISKSGFRRPWLVTLLHLRPAIYDRSVANRRLYGRIGANK